MNFISRLMPREGRFFQHFDNHAKLIVDGAVALADVLRHYENGTDRTAGLKLIEDAEQEVRLAGSVAQRLSFDPRERQEPAEPFRLFGQKTERLDCKRLREFAGHRLTPCHQELVCGVVSLRITGSRQNVRWDIGRQRQILSAVVAIHT